MEKHLRNAPTYAVIVALVIQVTRVSDFGARIGAGWLAWVYAIFLALTIYALSYWVGRLKYEVTAEPEDKRAYAQQIRMAKIYKRARTNSTLWLLLFLAIDGSLNFAETMSRLPASVSKWEFGGAAVYGVFPTLAAFGLGSLQAILDKVPAAPSKASLASKLIDKLLARLDTSDKQGVQDLHASNKQDQQGLHTSDKQGVQDLHTSSKQGLQGNMQVDKQADELAYKPNKQDETLQVQVDKQVLTDETLLAYWQASPQASDSQVAKHFGRTTQAIQQRRKKLIARGAFYLPAEVQS